MSRPPLFTTCCCKLVSDQVATRVGSASHRHCKRICKQILVTACSSAVRERIGVAEKPNKMDPFGRRKELEGWRRQHLSARRIFARQRIDSATLTRFI